MVAVTETLVVMMEELKFLKETVKKEEAPSTRAKRAANARARHPA